MVNEAHDKFVAKQAKEKNGFDFRAFAVEFGSPECTLGDLETLLHQYKSALRRFQDNETDRVVKKQVSDFLVKKFTTQNVLNMLLRLKEDKRPPSGITISSNGGSVFFQTGEGSTMHAAPETRLVEPAQPAETADPVDPTTSTRDEPSSPIPAGVSSLGKRDAIENMLRDLETPPQLSPLSPADFRLLVFKIGSNEIAGRTDLHDRRQLATHLGNFKPATMGEKMDVMAGRLALDLNRSNIFEVNALKLAMSHIIDLVNGRVLDIFKRYIKDDDFWGQLHASDSRNDHLASGLPDDLKGLCQEVLACGIDDDTGCMNKSLLLIAIHSRTIDAIKAKDSRAQQLLNIMQTLVDNCKDDNEDAEDDMSELTAYRRFMASVEILLRRSTIRRIDGEHVLETSKDIAKIHARLFGNSPPRKKPFGRRIDLILSAKNKIELCASEWRRPSVSVRMSLIQQSKNIRMNKAILTRLLCLPIVDKDKAKIVTMGMDFTGARGYMFKIMAIQDVYVARHVCRFITPSNIDDMEDVTSTLDKLYAWKHHHEALAAIVKRAAKTQADNEHFDSILPESALAVPASAPNTSPNIFLTPVIKRDKSAADPVTAGTSDPAQNGDSLFLCESDYDDYDDE